MNNKNLQTILNNGCYWNNTECKRTEKVLKMIDSGKINKDNYWDQIRKLTKNIVSDKGIREWQILSENIFKEVYEK